MFFSDKIAGKLRRPLWCTALIFSALTAHAQNKVVVIPLSGDDLKPLANVITVATENGDFDNLGDALTSITDSSSSNPYLIVIAPGKYSLTNPVSVPQNVHVSGSGQGFTILDAPGGVGGGSGPEANAAVIAMGDESFISNLTLDFEGIANNTSIGIFFDDDARGMDQVEIIADNRFDSNDIYGAFVISDTARISNSSISLIKTVTTGFAVTGIAFEDTNAILDSSNINLRSTGGGSLKAVRVLSGNNAPTIRNSRLRASYTTGTESFAFFSETSRPTMIKGSYLESNTDAASDAVRGNAGISGSSLVGGINASGTQFCVGSDNLNEDEISISSAEPLLDNCLTPP